MIALLKRIMKRVWHWRSAVTGKFVSREYAEKHRAETVRERIR